jgi:hypothetical protein
MQTLPNEPISDPYRSDLSLDEDYIIEGSQASPQKVHKHLELLEFIR